MALIVATVPLSARVNGVDIQVGTITFDLSADPVMDLSPEGLRMAAEQAGQLLKAMPGGA